MSNVANIANLPVEFELSGKQYKVARLSIIDLFGKFENIIKEEYMDSIVSYAGRLKNEKERMSFQREAIKGMPSGKEMEESVRVKMDSIDGATLIMTMALSKHNTVTEEEVRNIIMDPENSTTITTMMAYIVGEDVSVEDSPTKPDSSEKKMTASTVS